MTQPIPTRKESGRQRNLFASILCVGSVLAACSPEGPPTASAPPAPPRDPAAGQTTVIGAVDDLRALDAFLRTNAAGTRSSPPRAVVARTVEGGPAHPRITLVYMADSWWCGSGGCHLLVLEPAGDGLRELSRTTISHPPVRVLKTRTNGMPDLSVRVRGDYYPGDGPKFVALPFDGEAYALNPTVPPARLLAGPIEGEIVISEADVYNAFRR